MQRINISIIQTATERKSEKKGYFGVWGFLCFGFFKIKKLKIKKNPHHLVKAALSGVRKNRQIAQWEIQNPP